jgi:hypothetical protein
VSLLGNVRFTNRSNSDNSYVGLLSNKVVVNLVAQSTSWEVNICSESQIQHILWNLKFLVNKANLVHNLSLVCLSISTCLGRLCAHHQEKQLCLCDTWYLLFCVDNCLVCRVESMLTHVWQGKNLNIVSMCAMSPVVHTSNISSCKKRKKNFFSFPVAVKNYIKVGPLVFLL